MADVLIVCVREDEPQAKALAEMFEAAGFSIGGAPSNDGALRSSGAGVIVWSQASIRSRPFLDASQRVINAGKAVVASLIDPPPPSSIGNSPAFDLSEWDGDPNDAALDPLFFAVDRMVNAARASVGAAASVVEPPQEYEPPPPPPRASRPSAPAPQQSHRAAPAAPDHLGAEAEFWRAIRDSRNPSDFMDYLARFGPDGAFSEVAELRLKQLAGPTERAAAPRTPPRGSASMPSSRPIVRSEAPPPRSEPSRRAPDIPASSRRAEAAPTPRRAPAERNYDRYEDREPARAEGGGALRAFVLVALLGVALAGGLYFGGGLDFADSKEGPSAAEEAYASAPATAVPPDGLEPVEPESYSLSDATDLGRIDVAPAAAPRRDPPREQTQRPRETQRASNQTSAEAEEAAPPAPVTSWGTGGPLSLSPSQQQASNAASTPSNSVVPLTPAQPPPTQVASVEPTIGSLPRQTRPTGVVAWSLRPSARRMSELYPERALRNGTGGRVQLDCTVQANLSVVCSVASESPAGQGFGRAALAAASSYRAQAALTDGSSAVGARTRIAVNFQPPQ